VANGLLPATIDNTYRGRTLALWLFGGVVVVKAAQIVSLMVGGARILADADGIPLDTFSTDASRTVLAAFVGMGVSRLLICVVCALTLWRYRRAVPLVFTLLAVHDVARELVLRPIRTGMPIGAYVNWGLLIVTLTGLALSLVRSDN
jgi:fumarate reductase subunit D